MRQPREKTRNSIGMAQYGLGIHFILYALEPPPPMRNTRKKSHVLLADARIFDLNELVKSVLCQNRKLSIIVKHIGWDD
jgi:hypothetical protein